MRMVLALSGFVLSVLLFFSCQTFNKEKFVNDLLQSPQKHLSNYTFNPSSSLLSRVRKPEPFIMKYLQDMDNRPDYTPYVPSPGEMKTIGQAMDNLPPLTKKVMKERLVGIYFVNSLYGSGLSDWLIDRKGEIYTILVFNPVTLKMGLSEWLSWKENSAFLSGSPGGGIGIDCGKSYSAVYGILLHESAHGVDYVKNVNPFVEPATLYFNQLRNRKVPESTEFTENIWKYAGQPETTSDYPYRKKVHYYTDKNENKVPLAEAGECYRQLLSSPFVSLYGSQSWSEDLAEMVMYYHITSVLKQPYVISVSNNGTVASYKPMENLKVRERLKNIALFYR